MTNQNIEEIDLIGDIFNQDNIPESNYFKFNKVGDKVAGVLVGIEDKPAKGVFPPQRVYSLKQPKTGDIIKVGIALTKDYVIARANAAKAGDVLAFEFKKEIPPSKAGLAPAKSIEVYVRNIAKTEDSGLPF